MQKKDVIKHKAIYTAICPVCNQEFPADSWALAINQYLEHCKTANQNTPWGNHFRILDDVKRMPEQ